MCQDPDHLFPWFQILIQNKEAISFISVVTYGVFIPLSHPIHFCPLTNQKFEKHAQDPADPAKPLIQDPSGFLLIFMGFKWCHQRNPLSYKTLQHGQSGAIFRNTVDHHVLSELPFKHKTPHKTPRAWNMSAQGPCKKKLLTEEGCSNPWPMWNWSALVTENVPMQKKN